MKDYDKNKELSYPHYCDVNNLYGLAILQKLPVNNFKWIKNTSQFNESFIKNYNEWCFLEVNVQYLEKLQKLHDDLPFLPEKMKIEQGGKLLANLHDKTEYIRNFNKNACLKSYIDMNTDIRHKSKEWFRKRLF